MFTPSHFLTTLLIRVLLPHKRIRTRAFLFGAVAPDLPLILLSAGSYLFFHIFQDWAADETVRFMSEKLYFQNPVWISSHNVLHSPVVLLFGLYFVRATKKYYKETTCFLKWFLLSCLLHSSIDILTHHNDGPILFWPIDWTIRYHSPISYWDPIHYGRLFNAFELYLDIILLCIFTFIIWIACTAPSIISNYRCNDSTAAGRIIRTGQ